MRTLTLAWILSLLIVPGDLYAQASAFTYQGSLRDGTSLANGVYDLRFRLAYDSLGKAYANSGTAIFMDAISITNGLFTTALDFGQAPLNGTNLWLEVSVRTNGGATYT